MDNEFQFIHYYQGITMLQINGLTGFQTYIECFITVYVSGYIYSLNVVTVIDGSSGIASENA